MQHPTPSSLASMDPAVKKRKAEENGVGGGFDSVPAPAKLIPEDARKIIEPFSQEQLLEILQDAAVRHPDVLDAVRAIADRDPVQRKLFIRGLGWDTTTEGLRNLFSTYGDLDEAVVILDKSTGKSKGYGFVTFKHIDGALLALKEPSKKIDGRMTVTQLAAGGTSGPTANPPAVDVSLRKIFVGNVPSDMPADRLLAHFSSYGEIEEGPLGFDKQTGKSRGFALFVYKTVEAARASLVDPNKMIDGHTLSCKLAIDGKKGKPGSGPAGPEGAQPGDGVGMPPPSSMPSTLSSQYGGPGGLSSYGNLGFSGGHQGPGLVHSNPHLNSPLQSSIGGPGLSSVGGQVPSSLGAAGAGYGAGLSGGPYGSSQYGGPGAGMGAGAYGGPGAGVGAYGGGLGGGSSLYRLPPGSTGMPSGGFPESGHYGLSSTSSAYQSQHHPQTGSSPVPRVPSGGGMYPGVPPFY